MMNHTPIIENNPKAHEALASSAYTPLNPT
jgi:hypothetical protein